MTDELLQVRDLVTSFRSERGWTRAVDGVSFSVSEGGTLGVLGESGCGKSVTALSILQLIPFPHGRIESGSVRFEGRDLLRASEKEMRSVRGNKIAMIFQEPMSSLNPVLSVGTQVIEALRVHNRVSHGEARQRALQLLQMVGIPETERRLRAYPHELSGGMRQRVMIAMALSCEPRLLLADEPTTALDVTIQAQILDLLRRLQKELNMSVVLITHDLGVIAEIAERVVVMYAGKVVELAPTEALFSRPRHPYTKGLLASVPRPDLHRRRLPTIEGVVPDLGEWPGGCRFRDRCPDEIPICAMHEPPLDPMGRDHLAACHVASGRTTAPPAGENQ